MTRTTLGAIGALTLAAGAQARPILFTIDDTRSSVDLEITLNINGLGPNTDSDSSPVSGSLLQSFDAPPAPGETTLYDFDADLLDTLQFGWNYGILGSASAILEMGAFADATPAALDGPVPVVSSSATFPMVPVVGEGMLDVDFNFLLIGSGSESVDLGTLAPSEADVTQTIDISGGVITLSGDVSIQTTQPLELNGSQIGTVTIVGDLTLVATAPAPGCNADLNADGSASFPDVSLFLAAFTGSDLSADFNADGAVSFPDVSAFLSQFAAGCP